jgi:hypothetical protein
MLASFCYPLGLEIRMQALWNLNAAVRLLIGFNERDKYSSKRRAAPV